MKTITINGETYIAGTAKVEDDLNCLPGNYLVAMRRTTWMQVIFKRFTSIVKAREYAAELNAMQGA